MHFRPDTFRLNTTAHRGALVLAVAMLLSLAPLVSKVVTGSAQDSAFAQASDAAEAKAFDESKALGTAEAWNAFLSYYSTGFRADLARAYLKQLQTNAPAAANTAPPPPFLPTQAAPTAPEQAAIEQSCDTQRTVRPRDSTEPVRIRFVNESGGHIVLQRIDTDGSLKEAGTLEPGASVTKDTFLTHPWITAYGEGSCRQLFLPAGPFSVARLVPESALPKKAAAPKPQAQPRAPAPLKCAANYKNVRGQCVLLQNCGPNATRNPEGDCFCNRGFQMMNGQCQVPRQRSNQCSRHEVYSSSMGQCIPKAAMCGPNEVYSSSLASCMPR